MKVVCPLLVTAVAVLVVVACSSDDPVSSGSISLDGGSLSLDGATPNGDDVRGPGTDGGSDGGSTACVAGTKRCAGTPAVSLELCDSTATWKANGTCPWACKDGVCVGICGPGATQCASKDDTGAFGGSGSRIEGCVGAQCTAPHPVAIVVRTCDAEGQWQVTDTCEDACFGAASTKTVACGYCSATGGSPQATCEPSSGGSCQCPAH